MGDSLDRHIVRCPHCGEKALDHMTECPACHGALKPKGYTPIDQAKMTRIRRVARVIAFAGAAIVLLIHFMSRFAP